MKDRESWEKNLKLHYAQNNRARFAPCSKSLWKHNFMRTPNDKKVLSTNKLTNDLEKLTGNTLV